MADKGRWSEYSSLLFFFQLGTFVHGNPKVSRLAWSLLSDYGSLLSDHGSLLSDYGSLLSDY